ncbi:CpsD/CapB family tyrosine-protein kinase [Bacillus timonensis]|nr:CpsD/CapB family tyrosine-protein kinase [Bacillus timonensis]
MFKWTRKQQPILPLTEDDFDNEEARIIRTNITSSMKKEAKIIMVTSPTNVDKLPVFTSRIASAFLEQEKRVLLVDAHIRKPTIHSLFEMDNSYGLTDLLTCENLSYADIIQSHVSGLYILPVGPVHPYPSKLLATDKVDKLLANLWKEFDLIILHSPALLGLSDGQMLSNKCDVVLLVIQENNTKKSEVVKSIELLKRGYKKFIGSIYIK